MISPFRFLAAGLCLAVSASLASAATLQLNFGTAVGLTGWNNITTTIGLTSNGTLADLADSTGSATTVDFAMNSRFGSNNTNGATTNTYGLPTTVSASSLYGNSVTFGSIAPSTPKFTLSSLDVNSVYTFTIYASRTAVAAPVDVRTGVYTATGLDTVSGTLNATNNTSLTLTLLNVRPTAAGNIVFDIQTALDNTNANGFVYLNALTITSATAVPEPSTYAGIIGGAVLVLVVVRRRQLQFHRSS